MWGEIKAAEVLEKLSFLELKFVDEEYVLQLKNNIFGQRYEPMTWYFIGSFIQD